MLGAVLTYGSSFGYVATAMALRPPHYQQHLYQDEVYEVSIPTLRSGPRFSAMLECMHIDERHFACHSVMPGSVISPTGIGHTCPSSIGAAAQGKHCKTGRTVCGVPAV